MTKLAVEDPMPLRSSLTQLFGKLSDRAIWIGGTVVSLLAVTSAVGAGSAGCDDASLVCENGKCQVCDAYGCKPADPQPSGGGGSGGGGTSSGGGGGSNCDPTTQICGCSDTSDCEGGTKCILGLCIDGCDFSYECGAGKVCYNGQCAAGCDDMTPCAPGYTCDDGACVADPANPGCSAENPCLGDGEKCIAGVCTTACTTNADCQDGEVCNAVTGGCIPNPEPQPLCGPDKQCTGPGQVCMADGYCHYPCNDVAQCKLIDNRFVACDQGVCKTEEEINPECTLDKPCPVGEDCISNKCF
jgi:hypothetical protein